MGRVPYGVQSREPEELALQFSLAQPIALLETKRAGFGGGVLEPSTASSSESRPRLITTLLGGRGHFPTSHKNLNRAFAPARVYTVSDAFSLFFPCLVDHLLPSSARARSSLERAGCEVGFDERRPAGPPPNTGTAARHAISPNVL